MVLIYKFKKEKLLDGNYVSRPRILVTLHGKNISLDLPALIDTGCDTTVISEAMAKELGLNIQGKKTKLYAYRESTEVIQSNIDITFSGKVERETIRLQRIPVLIALSNDKFTDELDITLGIDGIFDNFNITFKKMANRIILKKVPKNL